jgi:hypothetical protein
VLAMCTMCHPNVLHTAEIRKDPFPRSNGSVAVIEGKIELGDFDRIRNFVFANFPVKIYLASPGGDLSEAMKIGHLLRTLKLATAVPDRFPRLEIRDMAASAHGLKDAKDNYLCASACFFIFVAGIQRETDFSGDGILGIHRPFMSDADLNGMGADTAMAAATKTKLLVASYVNEMGVPTKYVDAMFAIPKDEIRWIGHDDFVADFNGFIPELTDWVNARCDHRSDVDKRVWEAVKDKVDRQMTVAEKAMADALLQQRLQQARCEENVQSELAASAYKNAIDIRSDQAPAK